jgi:nucleoside-diphosphate-sugar epimerase
MVAANPTVVVTGVAGNLGLRLLPLLADFQVIGVDLNPPSTSLPVRFVQMDLAKEESCRQLYLLLKEARAIAVIHLAFVIDPVISGGLDLEQMWQINVAGTARVMEAITETNRDEVIVQKFIFPSSVSVYGSDLASPATETTPLAAHILPYALHKMECDKVVQQRAPALRGCSVFMLRPHIFAGASVHNYFLGAFRGTPNGRSKRAAKMRDQGKRLPCVLPYGQRYLENRMQFVHVDDMARLIEHIIGRTEPESQRLTILNVAGRGEALTLEQCIQMAGAKLIRVPTEGAFKMVLTVLWKLGISAIPPEALPYITGEYIMNTERLQAFLGPYYSKVIHYTIADAFADSFKADMSSIEPRTSAATSD